MQIFHTFASNKTNMSNPLKTILLFALLISSNLVVGQKNGKLKVYAGLHSSKAIFSNDTKYFGIDIGLKSKCRFKIGYSYSWLRGNYKTDLYPVDNITGITTKTDATFSAIAFEPIVLKDNKINISIPIKVGMADINSRYKNSGGTYIEYYDEYDPFIEVGANIDYQILGVVKLGASIGYRRLNTDLEVAQNTFSTPLFAFHIKFGRLCN